MKPYSCTVVIGRFQPVHMGHMELIQRARELGDRTVILVGSTQGPRSLDNPFTFEEREAMLRGSLKSLEGVVIRPLPDVPGDDPAWYALAKKTVLEVIAAAMPGNSPGVTLHGLDEGRIAIVASDKDGLDYAVVQFPGIDRVVLALKCDLSGTKVRHTVRELMKILSELPVPEFVRGFLRDKLQA